MDLGLRGKVGVVTGGSRGIGLAIAHRLVAEGAAVSICARRKDGLSAAQKELQAAGGTVLASVADVTNPDHLKRFVDDTADRIGRVDLVVANAGGTVGGNLREATAAQWAETFALNVGHAAALVRAAVPHLHRRKGGAVVVVSSISGWKPAAPAQYAAAKAAEIQLASSLAHELAPQKIRVNTVSPGSILVPGNGWDQVRQRRPAEFDEFLYRHLPADRLGTAEEVADVVAFLLSDRAAWINGANVPVDGGQTRASIAGY